MGQEFHVLRCFSCLVFQSHQVRKDRKFACKLCGAKQSVKKDYGRGTGKDCRVHVQKLNSLRGNLEEQEKRFESQHEEHDEPGSPWKASPQTNGTFTSDCHDTNIGNSADNVDRASSSVYEPKSKWASYITPEADNSEEDTVADTAPGISFRHNHIKESLDTVLRHKAPQIIQNKYAPQNSHREPVRSRVKKTGLLKWNKGQLGPYPGCSVDVRRNRSAANEILINKPALIGGGEPNGLVTVDKQSFKSEEEEIDESITSRGTVKISTTSMTVMACKQQCGDNKEHTATFADLEIRNLSNFKVGHTAFYGNSCVSSNQRCEIESPFLSKSDKSLEQNADPSFISKSKEMSKNCGWSQQGGILTGCTINDNLKSKATAIDDNQAIHDISLGNESYPVHKLNHFIVKQNITQNHVLTNAKEKSVSSSMNKERSLPIKNQLTSASLKNSSGVPQGVHGPTLALSLNHSDLSNEGNNNNCSKRMYSSIQLYSKYEAAEELDNLTNFDL
nr:uncharacterized protein LOC123757258 isoform X1 [Procambarus clarkii]XP_045596751.1 uncharacterized protein LOC123757258 isoform X1 [Procambarus clarkii]